MKNSLSDAQLRRFLSVARQAAQSGGRRALGYFGKKIKVIKKVDRSPVTRADREAEKIIRKIIQGAFPGHQLCGEEFGWDSRVKSDFKWWIDPVDGTRQFVRGIPFWGTLVALEYRGEVVAGVIHHPALSLTLSAAKGLGCEANGKKIRVSKIPNLEAGTLTYGGMRSFQPKTRVKFLGLVDKCHDDRGFGDCFGHSLVVQGAVEAMVDPVVNPYDVASIKICVEEAGGRFTDFKGNKTIHGGSAVSSNGKTHSQILKAVGKTNKSKG